MTVSGPKAIWKSEHMNSPEWEADWLGYARRLLNDTQHKLACDLALGTEAIRRSDADDLRWPGYLGSAYRPGGLLIAFTVHRELASGRPPLPDQARDGLVAATRAWRNESIDDSEWLTILRATYSAGLGRHWTVGKLLGHLGRLMPLRVDEIAYVNAARCQVVENAPVLARRRQIIKDVVERCTIDYPLRDLTAILKPAALVVPKETFDVARDDLPPEVPLFVIHQRRLCLQVSHRSGSWDLPAGTLIADWAPALWDLLRR